MPYSYEIARESAELLLRVGGKEISVRIPDFPVPHIDADIHYSGTPFEWEVAAVQEIERALLDIFANRPDAEHASGLRALATLVWQTAMQNHPRVEASLPFP